MEILQGEWQITICLLDSQLLFCMANAYKNAESRSQPITNARLILLTQSIEDLLILTPLYCILWITGFFEGYVCQMSSYYLLLFFFIKKRPYIDFFDKMNSFLNVGCDLSSEITWRLKCQIIKPHKRHILDTPDRNDGKNVVAIQFRDIQTFSGGIFLKIWFSSLYLLFMHSWFGYA